MDLIDKKIMRLIAVLLSVFSFTVISAQEQLKRQYAEVKDTTVWDMPLTGVSVKRNADLMTVGMDLKLKDYKLNGDKVTVFRPVLKNGKNSWQLNPVGLYSRIRYIQYLRDGKEPIGGENEMSFRYSKRPDEMVFNQSVPYAEWMNGATLYLERCVYGCCHTLLEEEMIPLARWYETTYIPAYHYAAPVTNEANREKIREIKGRAYIDFPVNKTEIYPEYRNNPTELLKIIATIDSVRNDEDVTIKQITIKGYASPESSWENNTRLAKGRTSTLKQYVRNLYNFDNNLIATDYEPEDWAGLREFVESSGLEHRKEILAIIDDVTIAPDPKEAQIKSLYPEEYAFLLHSVYPSLRHSDYTIEYTIRNFYDPDLIRKIMKEAPQKLSLEEMYIVAKSLDPGSEEYNEVFETAARMYPNDEIANLNAANSAMQRNDLAGAEKYLEKAGNSDEAIYAKGVLAVRNGEYEKALELFKSVASSIPEAAKAAFDISQILDISEE